MLRAQAARHLAGEVVLRGQAPALIFSERGGGGWPQMAGRLGPPQGGSHGAAPQPCCMGRLAAFGPPCWGCCRAARRWLARETSRHGPIGAGSCHPILGVWQGGRCRAREGRGTRAEWRLAVMTAGRLGAGHLPRPVAPRARTNRVRGVGAQWGAVSARRALGHVC